MYRWSWIWSRWNKLRQRISFYSKMNCLYHRKHFHEKENPQFKYQVTVRFYFRLFIKKCLGCSERVSPEELVMRASDNIFHLRCFVCVVCGIRLQKGDLYVIKQGQLFCRTDYEKEVEMMQGFGYGKFWFCFSFV